MWAYPRWGLSAATLYDADAGLPILLRSIEREPGTIGSYDQIAGIQVDQGRWEEALQTLQTQLSRLNNSQTYVAPSYIPARRRWAEAQIASLRGAYHDTLPVWDEFIRNPFPGFGTTGHPQRVSALTGEHDFAAARATVEEAHSVVPGGTPRMDAAFPAQESRLRQDWAGALAANGRLMALAQQSVRGRSTAATAVTPGLAETLAHLGRFAEAERAIAPTPGDSYPCLRIRAQLAELQHQSARADFWFARALAVGPSLPFASHEWGLALLARGKPDAAIDKFKLANEKGPHFADPLEGWGEALMAKNQSHLALAKFAQAQQYAPNWGRLHLKWGEALVYAGKKDEARKHFARAAQLDLTLSEKAELTRFSHA